jgi:hypothetical protein
MNSSITVAPLFFSRPNFSPPHKAKVTVRVLDVFTALVKDLASWMQCLRAPEKNDQSSHQGAAEDASSHRLKRSAGHKPWPAKGLQAIPSEVWPRMCNQDQPCFSRKVLVESYRNLGSARLCPGIEVEICAWPWEII